MHIRVSLVITGIVAFSITHSTTIRAISGSCPTAQRPYHVRSYHDINQIQFQAMCASIFHLCNQFVPFVAVLSAIISETISGPCPGTGGYILYLLRLISSPVADQFNIVQSHYTCSGCSQLQSNAKKHPPGYPAFSIPRHPSQLPNARITSSFLSVGGALANQKGWANEYQENLLGYIGHAAVFKEQYFMPRIQYSMIETEIWWALLLLHLYQPALHLPLPCRHLHRHPQIHRQYWYSLFAMIFPFVVGNII